MPRGTTLFRVCKVNRGALCLPFNASDHLRSLISKRRALKGLKFRQYKDFIITILIFDAAVLSHYEYAISPFSLFFSFLKCWSWGSGSAMGRRAKDALVNYMSGKRCSQALFLLAIFNFFISEILSFTKKMVIAKSCNDIVITSPSFFFKIVVNKNFI